MSVEIAPPRRTPLYEAHLAAGAKLVEFAGWEMPISYAGIRLEHLAVRHDVGVFDVSHMGQVQTRGPGAPDALQRLVSNDIRRIPEGGAQYGLLCNEQGGVLDDLFTYRLGETTFLTITNAANHDRDLAWMIANAGAFDAELVDRREEFAMLAVQGPNARALVGRLADGRLAVANALLRADGRRRRGAGVRHRLHRRGRRRVAACPGRRRRRLGRAARGGAAPIGLGARDTLRLEACYHLYGNDLSEDRDPIGAGLGWACVEDTGFIGAELSPPCVAPAPQRSSSRS